MNDRQKARLAFATALVLFLVSGVAAYISSSELLTTQKWVIHTHEVGATLGDVTNSVARASRARNAYWATGNEDFVTEFDAAVTQASATLRRLQELVADNPQQKQHAGLLDDVTQKRLANFRASITIRKTRGQDLDAQNELARQLQPLSTRAGVLTQEMQEEERQLLAIRSSRAHLLLQSSVGLLLFCFVLGLVLISVQFHLLTRELHARERTEAAFRDLSLRLLEVQDEERRKLSRDLHDSLGQHLAALQMQLSKISRKYSGDARFEECKVLLDRSISEVRTISYVLHPPDLDVVGFYAAARWFAAGFSEKSGIQITADIPDFEERLARPIELALFRVLQESLSNIHQHAKSSRARIELKVLAGQALLTVRDYGIGLPPEVLERLENNTLVDVGLAGMRTRVADLGGRLDIESAGTGTLISVAFPLLSANLA
jgi:signal transduction histidine kinase